MMKSAHLPQNCWSSMLIQISILSPRPQLRRMSKNWVCQVVFRLSNFLTSTVDCLRKMWRSPVYGFFKVKVEIKYEDNRKYHYFKCAARRCKGKGGVCRYQDSQDHAAMSNLKTHAVRCFGTDAVDAAFKKGPSTTPGTSIFGAFAQLGHQPVSFSHCTHTIDETRFASFPLCNSFMYLPMC
jgi:hypothetical protein